jgi:predicted nucleotidyltransferase
VIVVEQTQLDPRAAAYAEEVVAAIDSTVPVLGAFVLGSAAAGGFDPATSDLDLVVVVERPLTDERPEILRRLRGLASPFRDLELVVYAAGAQPPDLELNVNQGEERAEEKPFWFVLDAALAQEHAVPVAGGRPWSDFFARIQPDRVREAMQESLAWSERQPQDDEFARLNAIRTRRYLERGEWMSKAQAREEAGQ